MSDAERADVKNGIWLCASCHTLVDKNGGGGFPAPMLVEWKHRHASLVYSLLRSHRSPLAALRKHTEEGAIGQRAMDTLENHGALFVDFNSENLDYVAVSIKALRSELQLMLGDVVIDADLKSVLRALVRCCREAMNSTSVHPRAWQHELPRFRFQIGLLAKRLRDDHGCVVGPGIGTIIP